MAAARIVRLMAANSAKNNAIVSISASVRASAPSSLLLTVQSSSTRNFVSATNMVLEKHITKVPSMGDSITEVSEEIDMRDYSAMSSILFYFIPMIRISVSRRLFSIIDRLIGYGCGMDGSDWTKGGRGGEKTRIISQ